MSGERKISNEIDLFNVGFVFLRKQQWYYMVSKKIFNSPGFQILKKRHLSEEIYAQISQDTNGLQSKDLQLKQLSSYFDEKLKL